MRCDAGDSEYNAAVNRTFVGTGNPTDCQNLLDRIVAQDGSCQPAPCGIGSTYQPTLPRLMTFYAIGAFMPTVRATHALDADGIYVPDYGLKMAREFCVKVTDSAHALVSVSATARVV